MIERTNKRMNACIIAEVRGMWLLTVSITQKVVCILQHVVLRHRLITAMRKPLKSAARTWHSACSCSHQMIWNCEATIVCASVKPEPSCW